jgi:protoporphyrinogen oxidase
MSAHSSHDHLDFVVLGAGPTGLGAAYRLKELGCKSFHVYEAESTVGGLANSVTDSQGFTWDIGGHVQFSHYRYFDELMKLALGDQWLHHQRESWIWIEDRFVPYPLQNNIRHLKSETCWKCVEGLVRLYKNPITTKPANFGQWINATFGAGLADVFMRPYNFKVWAHPLETMDYAWIGERVAVTDLERVLNNIFHNTDDISWGPNNTFQFPLHGGTGAIWRSVAELVGHDRITLSSPAVRIDAQEHRVHFADGSSVRYETLISSLPVDTLTKLMRSPELQKSATGLAYSSTHIVGIGLTGQPAENLKKKCWMYFPENNCPFYRVTLFSNYSPNNVPDARKHWSLMAEVSESAHKPVDAQRITDDVIQGMRNTRLIGEGHEIISIWKTRVDHGYPTPTLSRDVALAAIQPKLASMGIHSRGRFGGWKYEVSNQDHSLMQGVELVNKLVHGVPEVTYWFPSTANNMQYAKS